MAEIDVFTHRQFVEKHGFLMNGRNAVIGCILRRREVHRLAVDKDFAFVGLVDTGEDFHERGFSRAVLADQRRHLAGIKRDVHVIKRSHTRKVLAMPRISRMGWSVAASAGSPTDWPPDWPRIARWIERLHSSQIPKIGFGKRQAALGATPNASFVRASFPKTVFHLSGCAFPIRRPWRTRRCSTRHRRTDRSLPLHRYRRS